MKIRTGFVSNSSSSSFVCDITGDSYEGYDGEYDVTHAVCMEGHDFAADDYPEVMAYIKTNGRWDLPGDVCPICNGSVKPNIIERLKRDMQRLNISIDDLK